MEINFGVGIANWDSYRATIREDIAHLEGFNLDKAAKMTCAEIKEELDRRSGRLELADIKNKGLYRRLNTIESAQTPRI